MNNVNVVKQSQIKEIIKSHYGSNKINHLYDIEDCLEFSYKNKLLIRYNYFDSWENNKIIIDKIINKNKKFIDNRFKNNDDCPICYELLKEQKFIKCCKRCLNVLCLPCYKKIMGNHESCMYKCPYCNYNDDYENIKNKVGYEDITEEKFELLMIGNKN